MMSECQPPSQERRGLHCTCTLHSDDSGSFAESAFENSLCQRDHIDTNSCNILWHPSLELKVHRHCEAYPGNLLFDGARPIQTVCLNDHLYVGAGALCGSERDRCRLFEYSIAHNTWDILDTHLAEFALASYHSKLTLLGGREYECDGHGVCTPKSNSPTNKLWILDDQYQFQEAEIPPMNKSRKSALAVSHKNHLIVVGGDDDKSKTIEVYDDVTKKWLFAPSLPETSQLQSIIIHPDGNLYIQLSHAMSSRVFWATLTSLSDSCTPNIQESNSESTSLWKEIPNSLDKVFSNLMLCHGNLLVLGGSHQHSNEKYVFIYQPSDPTQRWIDIADVPIDLHKYTQSASRTHIISLPDDKLLLFGHGETWTEVMFLISFHVSAVKLNCLFTLRDLEKLESGTNLPVYSKLQPFAFNLKAKIGLQGNLTDQKTYVRRALHGNRDPVHTFIVRWIDERKNSCTWDRLIQLLEEFDEKTFANQLKHYLTFAPVCPTPNVEELTTKKLESIKQDIEQLCSQDLLKDIQIHQQLQECVKLCDSAKTMLTEDYQKLETQHKELLKEKEELNTQLELLKQTKLHK